MEFPKECITTAKNGKKEVRVLISSGAYIMYEYEQDDGRKSNKYSILLKRNDGKIEHLMIVPLKGKELVVAHKVEGLNNRAIWDKRHKKAVMFP